MPLNMVCFFLGHPYMDAFGTDEVTFVTLLKGNWFLGILLSHKPFILDRCPVSGSLVGAPRCLPMDGVDALISDFQAIKQMCSYIHLVHELFKGFDFAFWCLGLCSGTSQPII
jgi:hypothetical protein